MPDNCIFCKILAGELESSIVAEDEHALAFMDISQINAGHVLIVPRRHAVELGDLSEEEAANVFRLVHRIAAALPNSGLRCDGYNLFQSNGTAAGQDVFHAHFHLIPRFRDDALQISIDPNRPKYDRDEMNQFAERIANAME